MSHSAITKRYASALYAEAEAAGSVDRVDSDMQLLQDTISASADLEQLFVSPVISSASKAAVIKRLFESRIDTLTLRFLLLVIEKGREAMTLAIVDAYRALRDEQRGIVDARVGVAIALNDDENAALKASLSKSFGKDVRLLVEHDKSLVGGLVVQVGDTVYDGSLKHQLSVLRGKLESGSFHTN